MEEDECVICTLHVSELKRWCNNCNLNLVVHPYCLHRWMTVRFHNTCPLCRGPIRRKPKEGIDFTGPPQSFSQTSPPPPPPLIPQAIHPPPPPNDDNTFFDSILESVRRLFQREEPAQRRVRIYVPEIFRGPPRNLFAPSRGMLLSDIEARSAIIRRAR